MNAVSNLAACYADQPSLWIVWSQHRTTSGAPGCSRPLPPPSRIGRSRDWWAASHFRTARAWLMRCVARRDLLDPRAPDRFLPCAGDAALLFPMLEMAGHGHARFLDEVHYLYRDTLPTNELNRDRSEALWCARQVRERGRRYPRLGVPPEATPR